jgi:hypothetical protein
MEYRTEICPHTERSKCGVALPETRKKELISKDALPVTGAGE